MKNRDFKKLLNYVISIAISVPLVLPCTVWASNTAVEGDLILDNSGIIRDGVSVSCNSSTMKGEYSNILDGNVDTFWFANSLANSAPTYFTVDLGRKAKISEIIYLPSNSWNANKVGEPDNGGYFRNGFDIQLSNDEFFTSSVTVKSIDYNTTLSLGETVSVSLNSEENVYRYVRVYKPIGGYIGANDIWIKGYEIEETGEVTDIVDLLHDENGLLRAGISVLSDFPTYNDRTDITLSNIVDGEDSTYWFSKFGQTAPYLTIDLGAAKTIKKIMYLPANGFIPNVSGNDDNGDYWRVGTAVQLSNSTASGDALTVGTVTGDTGVGEYFEVDLENNENKYRYIRIARPDNGVLGASEVKIYGYNDGETEVGTTAVDLLHNSDNTIKAGVRASCSGNIYNNGATCENLINGVTSDHVYLTGDVGNTYFQIDLGKTRTVTNIKYRVTDDLTGNYFRNRFFKIQVSSTEDFTEDVTTVMTVGNLGDNYDDSAYPQYFQVDLSGTGAGIGGETEISNAAGNISIKDGTITTVGMPEKCRYVRIISTDRYLGCSEICILGDDDSKAVNLTAYEGVTASSPNGSHSLAYLQGPEKVVDGLYDLKTNANGALDTSYAGYTAWVSPFNQSSPYVQIDLSAVREIDKVKILPFRGLNVDDTDTYFRWKFQIIGSNYEDFFDGGEVLATSLADSVARDEWYTADLSATVDNYRYIRVMVPGGGVIGLAEVQVWGYETDATGEPEEDEDTHIFNIDRSMKNVVYSADVAVVEGEMARLSFDGGVLAEFSDNSLHIGGKVEGSYPQGVYNVKINLNFAQKNVLVTVTMPDGSVVKRGCHELFDRAIAASKIIFEKTGDCLISNESVCYPEVTEEEYILSDEIVKTGFELKAYNLITSFNSDAKTTRSFAWTAVKDFDNMAVCYGKADEFGDETKRKIVMAVKEIPEEAANQEVIYYKADIAELMPGTEYTYMIGDITDNEWGKTYSFTTEEENLDSFSFVALSDTQGTNWTGFSYAKAALDEAMKDAPSARFVVNAGDIVEYGANDTLWNYYFDAMKGVSETVPMFAALGNHDVLGTVYGAENKPYGDMLFDLHFNHPDNGGKAAFGDFDENDVSSSTAKNMMKNIDETVYSFDYGNVHIAVLNTGVTASAVEDNAILEAQGEWLSKDLAQSDAKWKILLMHQSVYHRRDESLNCDAISDLIENSDVDLVINGHEHLVKRSYPINNSEIVTKINPDNIEKGSGTVYATIGSTVASHDILSDSSEKYAIVNALESLLATYTVVDVAEDEIKLTVKAINGLVIDSFTISDVETEIADVTIGGQSASVSDFVAGKEGTVCIDWNYEDADKGAFVAYVAYYDEFGRLNMAQKIEENNNTFDFIVPDVGDVDSVKVFLWDSVEGISPAASQFKID